MLPIKIVLHATDFAPDSARAFEVACSLARHYSARVVVLHVMLPSRAPFGEPVPDPAQPAEAQANLRWRFHWPESPDPDVPVEHRVTEGDAAEEILRLAESLHCDLIVMGTRGRSGVGRLLTGSVATEVLRRAGCPVITVKAADDSAILPSISSSPPVEVVDVRPLGPATLLRLKSTTLMFTDNLRIDRWIIPFREQLVDEARGEMIVQCLEGCVAVAACGKNQKLAAGNLVYLPSGESYTITGLEDASILLTTFGVSLQP